MDSFIFNTTHPHYSDTIEQVRLVLDCVQGSWCVKYGDRNAEYLKNPSEAKDYVNYNGHNDAKFLAYKDRAEFDGIPAHTLSRWCGAMSASPPNIELPKSIDYLVSDSDGSGTPLSESIEMTQSSIAQVKFHCLLSDYNGVDIEGDLTDAQAKSMGFKATIKHYPRQSLVDWDFGVVNGIKQLVYAKLTEEIAVVDHETGQRKNLTSRLILGLDDIGYYQRKATKPEPGSEGSSQELSEKKYPRDGSGNTFKKIPFEIIIDQKDSMHSIPKSMGILYPICLKTITRYQVSADYMASLHKAGSPTAWSSGWDAHSFEIFKDMTGSETFGSGIDAHIPLPPGGNIGYLTWDGDNNAFVVFMDNNQKQIRALGGAFNTSDSNDEAVGVAQLKQAEVLSSLINIATSTEAGYMRSLKSCLQFMESAPNFENIKLTINKEFDKVKISPQQQDVIRKSYLDGVTDREEALLQLKSGGVLIGDVEDILKRATLTGE
ncbi:MAG: hypothetical protein ACJAYB_000015 [Psychromonas sp.]|jgi:hypothetical protein